MKAAILRSYGGPGVMEYADVPDPPPEEGQLLVKVAAASINPVDRFERNGEPKAYRRSTFPRSSVGAFPEPSYKSAPA